MMWARQGRMRPLDPRLTPPETQRKAAMSNEVEEELAALPLMTPTELCRRYEQLFGQPVRTRHKAYLVRKIAWRIQAMAECDLAERARRFWIGISRSSRLRRAIRPGCASARSW